MASSRSEIRAAGSLLLAVACLLGVACGSGTDDKALTTEQKDAIARAAGQPSSGQSVSTLFDRLGGTGASGQGSRAADLVRRATVPVIESPYKERRQDLDSRLLREFSAPSPSAAAGSERTYPPRVFFEDLDWMAALPAPPDEVPGVRIGWYLNSSVAALAAAIDQNKPAVIIIGESSCADCVRLAKALRCAAVERLAGEAIFAYGLPSRDKSTMAIANSFKIESYPVITVLEPETRVLIERFRIEGFFDATAFGGHLEEALWRAAPRIYADIDPSAAVDPRASPRGVRPATVQEAEAGAKQRGLVHGPPAPVCR